MIINLIIMLIKIELNSIELAWTLIELNGVGT